VNEPVEKQWNALQSVSRSIEFILGANAYYIDKKLSMFVLKSKTIKKARCFLAKAQRAPRNACLFEFNPGLEGFLRVLCELCERRL
jgi:hypothetical protein